MCVNGSCPADRFDGINCAKKCNKPIFLLFTGYACVGDNSYEEELFINRTNRKIIAENYVPVVLYVDDKKELNEVDKRKVFISGKEKVMRTIGNKNAYYEINKYKQNAQPLLAILDQFGEDIVSPVGYKKSPYQYQVFLESGLRKYNEIEF